MHIRFKKGLLVWGDVNITYLLFFLFIVFPIISTVFPPETYFRVTTSGAAIPRTENPIFSKLTFMAMVGFLGWVYFKHPKSAFLYMVKGTPIFLLGLYMLVSSLWAPDFLDGFNKAYRTMAVIALAGGLYFTYRDNKPEALIGASLNTAMVISLFMVLCLPQYGLSGLRSYLGAWKGAFIQKNVLGEVASYALMFAIYQASIVRTSKARLTQLGMAVLAVIMLIMSQSGTSLLSAVMALSVFAILYLISQLSRQKVRVVVFAIMALLGFTYATAGVNTDLIFQLTGKSSDFTGRKPIWDAVKEAIAEKPLFGHGSGFWITDNVDRNYLWSRVGDKPPHSHNTYLDMSLQYGYLGVSLFALVCVTICFLSIRELIKNKSFAPIFYFSFFVLLTVRSMTEVTVGASDTSVFWYAMPLFGLIKVSAFAPVRSSAPGEAPSMDQKVIRKRRIRRVSHYYK